ncbi:DNA circularization N-terminal domain-containing protein [Treponema pectinovorum]|uniref:DNA circularization N-terminal domain-containing protein n=1 Tax=Treponema pectinovorum TaxID=164 RepID=UPI0011CCB87C|nr:DNA circularization N-terminal domain-containing protein [Treponema pectinovorum]
MSEAVKFDTSLPQTYSDSWREAYGQTNDTARLSSYQAPGGKPVMFAYDSISLSSGQNVDTAEYPYGFWSNTRLGEKPQSIKIKGHLIGEEYIKQRTDLVSALQVVTDDDNFGVLDLPLWGRFGVVLINWNVDEDKEKTGLSDLSIEFVRAGFSEKKQFERVSAFIERQSVNGAVENLKNASVNAFSVAVEKSKDVTTLSQGFAKLAAKLQSIVGRVQGDINTLNTMTNKIKGITNLIAQAVLSPRELAQAFVSAAFGIVAGILEIKNAVAETASYFMGDDDDGGSESSATLSSGKKEKMSQDFRAMNEKNVLVQFLTATTYSFGEETITEQQYNTVSAIENLYKAVSFGVCAQLLTKIDPKSQTYESQSGLWSLFEKLEDSINKEDSSLFATVEECRIACAEVLLSFSYDIELKRAIRKEMPLLDLAMYLGCDEDKIRTLNSVSDSFLIKGDIVYV